MALVAFFAGQNRFAQFELADRYVWKFKELNLPLAKDIFCSPIFSVISFGSKIQIRSADFEDVMHPSKMKQLISWFDLPSPVKKMDGNSSHCLILLSNGDVYQYNSVSDELKPLNFLAVETVPVKKSIFTLEWRKEPEMIVDIACGETISVAVTNLGSIYNIPSKIFQLPAHEKVEKVCCGSEHAILLTKNGDVYTWGTGLRGQLGHGQIGNQEVPTRVEALAGIKVVDIGAGGWHSAAVTAFKDLYMFGWNSHGQLGTKVYESGSTGRRNQSVYSSPIHIFLVRNSNSEAEWDEIGISAVFCGNKHTILATDQNNLLVAGSNAYGQLGVPRSVNVGFQCHHTLDDIFVDRFKTLDTSKFGANFRVVCGYFSTIIINSDEGATSVQG